MRAQITMMAALAAGVSLAACERSQPQVATLPLEMGAAAPLGEAPPPGGLPPAPPVRFATLADYRDAYAYPDRAWGLAWAFGDSPPDYAFDDDGVTPWVWIADDDSECLAEPVPGGERYYYFEPGVYTPFYVQDPSYGYGFQDGQLVAIYDRAGREVSPAADPTAAATAGQYLARGRTLRQAAASQPRLPVAAANWSARRGLIAEQRTMLEQDAASAPAWRSYHAQHQAQQQAHLAPEATRREAWAAQTDSRLGQPARAQREQRLAQAFSQGDMAAPHDQAGPQLPARAPRAEASRYAEAPRLARSTPAPPAFAAPPPERPAAVARSAAEHANEAAYRARAAASAAEQRSAAPPPAAAPQPHAFHAPAAQPPPAQAAAPAHGPPPAAARPQGGQPGDGKDDKHH